MIFRGGNFFSITGFMTIGRAHDEFQHRDHDLSRFNRRRGFRLVLETS